MSLTAILKKLDRLNEHHRALNQRYNPSSRSCPRRADLKEEDRQDQLTFGNSHAQMLQHLQETHHLKPLKNLDQTRPSTAMPSKSTRPATAQTFRRKNAAKRPYTAVKAVPYRQQYNFFFKEDIFGDGEGEARVQLPCQTVVQSRHMQESLSHHLAPKSVNTTSQKAKVEQQKVFARNFNHNLERLGESKKGRGLSKVAHNRVLYDKKENNLQIISRKGGKLSSDDVFHLTTPSNEQGLAKKAVRLGSGGESLRAVRLLLNKRERREVSPELRKVEYGRSQSLWNMVLSKHLPSHFSLTIISVSTLQSTTLAVRLNAEGHMVEESGTSPSIQKIIENILAQHPLVHLCLHHDNVLLLQEFVLSRPLSQFRSRQNAYTLVLYYLKRFLLFDSGSSQAAAHSSAQLLLKSNTQIPSEFGQFIDGMRGKVCHIFDGDHRLYLLNLRDLLASGVASIEAFKKEMGFGQRVVKLKRDSVEKLQYNWEYFYI